MVYKTGQNFKVLLETEKNGVHFALLENMGRSWLYNNFLKSLRNNDFKALGIKGGYYLF